jgi:glucose-1-phosphate cytidylyltransferase
LNYDECISNDFIYQNGGQKLQLLSSDIQDWTITMVDTGLLSNIGQRLKAVEKYLAGEDYFLANYSDGLTDLCLPDQLEHFYRHDRVASFISVRPTQSFHLVSVDEQDIVQDIEHVSRSNVRINGGYFIFKHEIFDEIQAGEELVEQPFFRLIAKKELVAYPYNGFWACMDTFKEKQLLDDLYARGEAPWEVWKTNRSHAQNVRLPG